MVSIQLLLSGSTRETWQRFTDSSIHCIHPPPPPKPTLPRVYTEKTWAGLWWVAPQRTEISACSCSAWRNLARQASWLTWNRLHEKKLACPQGHPVSPTEWPYPWARFAVSHVNGWWWFISNCRRTWLALVGLGGGEGASGSRANFSPYCINTGPTSTKTTVFVYEILHCSCKQ